MTKSGTRSRSPKCCCVPCCFDMCRDGCATGLDSNLDPKGGKRLQMSFILGGASDAPGLGAVSCDHPTCDSFNGVTFGAVNVSCISVPSGICDLNYLRDAGHEPLIVDDGAEFPLVDGNWFGPAAIACSSFAFLAYGGIVQTVDGDYVLFGGVSNNGANPFFRHIGHVVLETGRKPLCGGIDETFVIGPNASTFRDVFGFDSPCFAGTPTFCDLPTELTILGTWVDYP